MPTIHIFAGKRWSGDATLALHAALKSGGMILTEARENAISRCESAGIKDVRKVNMSGLFGALNLSRMLRIVRPEEIVVHSSSLVQKAAQAVALSGLTVKIIEMTGSANYNPETHTPIKSGQSFIWIGYITPQCGLGTLLDAMKDVPEAMLRVVGEGEAKVVSPLLKKAKSPQLCGRIEWVGEQSDVYEMMNGCKAGIITSDNPSETFVYKEFIAAGLPVISGTTVADLKAALTSFGNEKNIDN